MVSLHNKCVLNDWCISVSPWLSRCASDGPLRLKCSFRRTSLLYSCLRRFARALVPSACSALPVAYLYSTRIRSIIRTLPSSGYAGAFAVRLRLLCIRRGGWFCICEMQAKGQQKMWWLSGELVVLPRTEAQEWVRLSCSKFEAFVRKRLTP